MKLFDCDDVGNTDDYVGCKLNGDDSFNFTQTVMLQRFSDWFDVTKRVPTTQEMPGKTLEKTTEADIDQHEETR